MRPLDLLLGMVVCGGACGHMMMKYPVCRGDPDNKAYGRPDYNLSAPLKSAIMCGGKPPGPPTASFKAGETINVRFKGSARHGGGLCQFALSYDNRNFVVIEQIEGACPDARYSWPVKLPKNLPSCRRCTFAWTWINAIGNREYYMNCADISIQGRRGSSIRGTRLLLANLPGYRIMQPHPRDGGPSASSIRRYKVSAY